MNLDFEYSTSSYTMSMTRIKTDKSIIFIDIVDRKGHRVKIGKVPRILKKLPKIT